jgi:hypothetical protein
MYTIYMSDGNVLTTIADYTINTSACSLALLGFRSTGYGVSVAQNFVALAENFSASSPPANPLVGQLWFNNNSLTLNIFTGSSWNQIAQFTTNGTMLTGYQLTLTCPNGVTPIITQSQTKVTNLNCDLIDGYDTAIPATPLTVAIRNSNGDLLANHFIGQASSATYADLAERFEASEALSPGDVVQVGGDKEICKAVDATAVLGVISANPGYRMNESAGSDATHPFVAYLGRIPCQVYGTVKKGQQLVLSSIPGVAKAISADTPPTALKIGRALQDKTTSDVEAMMIVVGVK